MTWIVLSLAVLCEVIATTALKLSDSFTRLWPSLITVVFYALAFWLITFPMRTLPTGIIYAIWSGAGIVLISLIGWLLYGQRLDVPAILGIALIIAGVLVINLFSRAVTH